MANSPVAAIDLYLDLKWFETKKATHLEQLALAHLFAEVVDAYEVQAFLAAILTVDTASNVIPALRQRIKKTMQAISRTDA